MTLDSKRAYLHDLELSYESLNEKVAEQTFNAEMYIKKKNLDESFTKRYISDFIDHINKDNLHDKIKEGIENVKNHFNDTNGDGQFLEAVKHTNELLDEYWKIVNADFPKIFI